MFYIHDELFNSIREGLRDAIQQNIPDDERFTFLNGIEDKSRDDIQSFGFVLNTLEVALWCNLHSASYAECAQMAVEFGNDTDTNACVAGALAGARYGYDAIPKEWIQDLRGKDVIDSCLFE